MKNSFLLSLFIFLTISLNAQYSKQRGIVSVDSMSMCQNVFQLFQSSDGNYIIFEDRCIQPSHWEMWVHKFDTDFNPLMATRIIHQVPSGSANIGYDIVQLPDSGFMILYRDVSDFNSVHLLKLDKSGQYVNRFKFQAPTAIDSQHLTLMGNDTLLISFNKLIIPGLAGVLMTDLNGNILQNFQLSMSGLETQASNLFVSSDHHIVQIAHSRIYPSGKRQATVTKFNAAGVLQWARVMQDTSNWHWLFKGIELSNGNYLFSGMQSPVSWPVAKAMLMCLSPSGQLLWSKLYSPLSLEFYDMVEIGPDSVFISGEFFNVRKGVNLLVDFQGNVLNSYQFNAGYSDHLDSRSIIAGNGAIISATTMWSDTSYILTKSSPFGFGSCNTLPFSVTETTPTFTIDTAVVTGTVNFTAITQSHNFNFVYGLLPSVHNICSVTSLEEPASYKLEIIPNPAVDNVKITFISDGSNEIKDYLLTDTMGKQILKGSFTANSAILDLEYLQPGLYIIHVSGNYVSFAEKIVRQ